MTVQTKPAAAEAERPLTAAEVSVILGVTENTLAIWRHFDRGPCFLKVGRAVRYEPGDVEAWKKARRHECNPDIEGIRRSR